MKCLVTGANGFLGRHVVRNLAKAGHAVIALSRKPMEFKGSSIKTVAFDFAQPKLINDLDRVDVLIHLAHLINDRAEGKLSPAYFRNRITVNLAGIFTLLSSIRGVKRVVYASSVFVYPWESNENVTEAIPPAPYTIYGWEKLFAEKLLEEFSSQNSISLAVLRLTQLYGPGEPHDQFITRMLRAAHMGHELYVFGEGEDARDILMVKDAAHAFDLAVESNSEGIFNVSSGNTTDLRAFGHLCLELVGRSPDELKFKSTTTPAVRVGYSYHKAEQFFNYKPQISLRDGLVKTLNEFE